MALAFAPTESRQRMAADAAVVIASLDMTFPHHRQEEA